MPPRTRTTIAKPDIVQLFRQAKQRVYRKSDIEQILADNRKFWRLAQSTTVNQFISFLLSGTALKEERIEFPYRPALCYTWGEVGPLAVIQAINKDGYFTHYTAMHLHGLTEQLPKAIYFNQEQRASGGDGNLSQRGIDIAFRRKCRVTSNVAPFRNQQVHMLSGKNTNRLGVINSMTSDGEDIRVTNVERTLIDITVRPIYAGGVFEVAKAFVRASEEFSVNKLVATLRKLNYTYPYHQAIGFYMERSGKYTPSQLNLLRALPIEFDFYLDYAFKQTDYHADWKLYAPSGF